jgi:hypothetical protein
MNKLKPNEYVILLFLVNYTEDDKDCYCTLGPAFRTYNSDDELLRFEENILDEIGRFGEDRYKNAKITKLIIQF